MAAQFIYRRTMLVVPILTILVTMPCFTMAFQGSPRVVIRQGTICGIPDQTERGNSYLSFLGIPYARPPIAQLRFRDPVPHPGWESEEFLADKFGPTCPQWDTITRTVIGQEDCLYLNVFTPQVASIYERDPLPVMFYIHGGAFMRGSASPHGPAKLLSDGSVVLVTVNYRLGVLGFLSTEDNEAPGNYGMLDLVLALQWVRDNIRHFGGDAQRVTIFGESAGAAAVSLLLLSPLAKGLFWTAIEQSGSALCDWTVEEKPQEYAMLVAGSLGCNIHDSREIVECLRHRSFADIVTAQQRQLKLVYFPLRAAPVVDRNFRSRPFLPERPEVILASGNFSRVPLISGVMEHEGLFFVLQMLLENAEQIARDPHYVEDYILPTAIETTTDNPYSHHKLNKFKNFYFKNVDFNRISEVIPPFSDMMADILFDSCNDRMVKLYSKWVPVYMYVFDHRGNISYSDPIYSRARDIHIRSPLLDTGATHVDDLIYLFNMPNIPRFYSPEDQAVQNMMVLLWTTFAKFATPNHPQASPNLWINYHVETMSYYRIGPNTHNAAFFRKYELSVFDYIDLTPSSPEAYTAENPHAYYVATWVLVAIAALLVIAIVVLSVFLARASHKRSYSTSRLNESNNVSVVSN